MLLQCEFLTSVYVLARLNAPLVLIHLKDIRVVLLVQLGSIAQLRAAPRFRVPLVIIILYRMLQHVCSVQLVTNAQMQHKIQYNVLWDILHMLHPRTAHHALLDMHVYHRQSIVNSSVGLVHILLEARAIVQVARVLKY